MQFLIGQICLLLVALSAVTQASDWTLKDFAFRRRIVVVEAAPEVRVAHVRLSTLGAIRKDAGDIRITDAAGQLMNHELLRSGPGDQVELLFEGTGCRKDSVYFAYFGNANAPAPKAWQAEAGVVLEIRKKGDGDCNNWGEFKKLFDNSHEVLGRTLRPKIFDGYDVLGPNENFVSYYRAYFKVEKPGVYRFATNSDDGSFLFVNGALTAEYPGWHGAGASLAEHAGDQTLRAGVNKLEYYHVQGGGETATCAAWKRPDDRYPVLMDDNAFVPVAKTIAEPAEAVNGEPLLDFSWAPHDHLVLNGHYMVRYEFEAAGAYAGKALWKFGDGSEESADKAASPAKLMHIFIAPGTYPITLSAADSKFKPLTQNVVVEPNWHQREEWDDNRWQEYRKAVAARLVSGSLRPEETASIMFFALALSDSKLLEQCASRAWEQARQFSPADHGQMFFTLGSHLQRELKNYALADKAFREVIAGPGDPKIKERAKLHRGGLLIHMLGKNQEGFDQLKDIDDKLLDPPHEPILRQIFMADACAGLGQVDEALKRYGSLSPVVNMSDRPYSVRRRGRLLAINTYIKHKEYDDALQELQNIEWETPRERVTDEIGLLHTECFLGKGDYQLAVILLQRLINMNAASARMPEMLFDLLKAYRALKDKNEAEQTFLKLKKEHPYSMETALAAMLGRE